MLGAAVASIVILGTVTQAANAAWQKLPDMRSEVPLSTQDVSLAKTAWDDYQHAGLGCRSSLDGSNPDVIERVKARLADPASFSHITTTLWPHDNGDHEVTMMFRADDGAGNGVVRQAYARIDRRTCEATLLSIS